VGVARVSEEKSKMNGLRLTLIALLSALSVCATSSTLKEKAAPAARPAAKATIKLAPEFQKLYDQFSAGFAKRDIETLMAVFDKSVVLSYQDAADSNFDEIKTGFEYDFKHDPPEWGWRGYPEESHQDGNLAIVVAHWAYQATVNGITETKLRIRSVDVLKRANGKWKIVRTINYPEA
jgi:ketosteroid isomerase-like protein